MKDSGNIVIFGADEGDMIINKATGLRTPITDTGKEFVLDIYVPAGKEEKPPDKKNDDKDKSSGSKQCCEKISYGCKATTGGFWNSLVEEDDSPVCQACDPATFRRHP